jgi:ribonuclease P protein component
MQRPYRLTKNVDFQAVRDSRCSWAHPLVVLAARPNGLTVTRFGFAVGKRLGKAVVRNRLKRRLREAARRQQPTIAPGWDLVFIARQPLLAADFAQIVAAVEQLLRRAQLLPSEASRPAKE